jgi:FixJ family two-component response regulator
VYHKQSESGYNSPDTQTQKAGRLMAHEMIVIIDDDMIFMEMMCDLLQEEGYQVRCFATGKEVQLAIQQEQPALIILDLYYGATR